MVETPTPPTPTVVRRPAVPDASIQVLKASDGSRAWTFLYDDAACPVASSGRVEVYRGTVLGEGEVPRRAVAKVLRHPTAGARNAAVMNAGIAFASGAGPSFLCSNCEGGTGSLQDAALVEEDCGISLRDVLINADAPVPGPGVAKPLFPPGCDTNGVAYKIFFDLCAHMAVLHRAGYAHCDIRPGNVAVRRFGPRPEDIRATLIDFETLTPLTGLVVAASNEYRALVEEYLGRAPLPLELDVACVHMVLGQLRRREAAPTPAMARACGEWLDGEFRLAHEGPYGCLRQVGSHDFEALGRRLGLVPVGSLASRDLPALASCTGFLDYLGCRWIRESHERGPELIEVGVRLRDGASAREAAATELAELITNCVYELREEGDGRISLARFARWARDNGRELPDPQALGVGSVEDAVRLVRREGRLPGIALDHRATLALTSEQVRAKQRINRAGKERIAVLATELIVDCVRGRRDFASPRPAAPKTIFVDGGSTTQGIIEGLCDLVMGDGLTNVRIVTPSVRHAARLSECFMDKGCDDHYDTVSLYVAGGLVRPGTQSTISQAVGIKNQVGALKGVLGRRGRFGAACFDLAFLGASRLSSNGAVTTTGGVSLENKIPALDAREPYIVLDSTKVQDPPFDHGLASLAQHPRLRVITNRCDGNPVLAQVAKRFPGRILLV